MRTVLASFFLGLMVCVTPVRSQTKAPTSWSFERHTDKITDKVACHLNSPKGKLMYSIQGWVMYIISGSPISAAAQERIALRVDKNPPVDAPLDIITPNLAAFRSVTSDWLDELASGKVLLVRVLGNVTQVEEEISLKTFPAAYRAYQACRKQIGES